ncbi:hypothetical protein LAD67_03760 [Escherichia coli]|nr:hypothetical protein [Escherichia coli]
MLQLKRRTVRRTGTLSSVTEEWQPDEIIVGCTLNMDGTEQPLTARARKLPTVFMAFSVLK